MPTIAEAKAVQYKVNQGAKPPVLEGFSEKLLEQHWKLYEGYVAQCNSLDTKIQEALKTGADISKPPLSEIQRRFGFEFNGMVLHEYYFAGMKRGVRTPPASSPFSFAAASSYGSFEGWKKHFMDIGRMRGVGWAITVLDPLIRRLVNIWVNDHETGHIAGFIPVIVMDCWEHAYVLDYGASGRSEYVQAYFHNLNWEVAEERLESALHGGLVPRVKEL